VDNIYNDFLERVSTARKLPLHQVNEIAQGRVWAGAEALRLKLVDEFGGLRDAVIYAGKQVGLGDQPAIVEYPARKDFSTKLKEILRGRERPPVTKADALSRGLEILKAELKALSRLNDPENAYARLPFGIQWE
jgi:protease-4